MPHARGVAATVGVGTTGPGLHSDGYVVRPPAPARSAQPALNREMQATQVFRL